MSSTKRASLSSPRGVVCRKGFGAGHFAFWHRVSVGTGGIVSEEWPDCRGNVAEKRVIISEMCELSEIGTGFSHEMTGCHFHTVLKWGVEGDGTLGTRACWAATRIAMKDGVGEAVSVDCASTMVPVSGGPIWRLRGRAVGVNGLVEGVGRKGCVTNVGGSEVIICLEAAEGHVLRLLSPIVWNG